MPKFDLYDYDPFGSLDGLNGVAKEQSTAAGGHDSVGPMPVEAPAKAKEK